MARILITSSEEHQRFSTMLAIARGLRCRGHEVHMLTGPASRAVVRAAGLGALTVPAVSTDPDGARRASLAAALNLSFFDAVLVDDLFASDVPARTGLRDVRRPVVLAVSEPGTRSHTDAARAAGDPDVFDAVFGLTLAGVQPASRQPRGAVRLLGPLTPAPQHRMTPPPWWGDVEETRPVVLVTQRRGGESDLGRLLIPTVRALASEPMLVVAATGALPARVLREQHRGPLPANVRVARWLPNDQLMPHLAAVVTDDGSATVFAALRHGVPLVVAPPSSQSSGLAAGIARSGAGIRLRIGARQPVVIRHAVQRVLTDDRHWHAARRLQAELRQREDPLDVIHAAVTELTRDAALDHLTPPPSQAAEPAALSAALAAALFA